VNALLALLALLSLAPRLWMLSVSFMPPGEASHFPPPLLPSKASWHNYEQTVLARGHGPLLSSTAC
jgi:multiple sugar transport system permease protein